jgi:CO/xanthine dehydrogenase Mo-binding subunit
MVTKYGDYPDFTSDGKFNVIGTRPVRRDGVDKVTGRANPGSPHGIRGVDEVPIVPPMAAVADAIFAATGCRMTALPITPDNLVGALREHEAAMPEAAG